MKEKTIILLHTVTKADELIFAQPIHMTTLLDAQLALADTYRIVITDETAKDIKYEQGKSLSFIDHQDGKIDEYHKMEIIEKEVK